MVWINEKRVVMVWLVGESIGNRGGGVDTQEEGGDSVVGRESIGDREGGVDEREVGGNGVVGREFIGDRRGSEGVSSWDVGGVLC